MWQATAGLGQHVVQRQGAGQWEMACTHCPGPSPSTPTLELEQEVLWGDQKPPPQ